MNMVCVAIPRTHLSHPGFIILASYPAQLFFYCCIDENPLDLGLLSCRSNEGHISSTPLFTVDIFAVRSHEVDSRSVVALFFAQHSIRHRHEPDVDVEPDLMTFMSKRERAAA